MSLNHFRTAFAVFASVLLAWVGAIPTHAQPLPFDPVPDTEMVDTGEFGMVPRSIIWKTDGREMILIPRGTYQIGRPAGVREDVPISESPTATVTLGWYYIDKYEVDQQRYNRFAETQGGRRISTSANPELMADHLPTVGITYIDALNYARFHGRDLPTEAEWEVAARGQQGNLYPWGNQPEEGATRVALGIASGTVAPGASPRDLSPFGLYDMAGNVSEWTRDYYTRTYYSQVDGKENPSIDTAADSRTIRGGSVGDRSSDGRLTQRTPGLPNAALEHVGFRTVFRLTPPTPPTPTPEPTPSPVPRTSIEEQERRALTQLERFIRDPKQEIPLSYLLASRARTAVNYMNLTPDQLIVAAIDIPSARLATQPVIIEAGQTGAMPLADDQAFYHYVFSPSMPELGVLPIGVVNNGSQPVVLLHSEMFYPAVDEEGKVVERLQGELEALQFYPGEYAPQWNTFEIYNRTTNVIRVTAMSVDPRAPDVPQSRILEPHQLTRIVGFTGLQVELGVEYVGGASPALDPGFRFMNDSAADLRILVIEEDPKDARKVNILTRQAPMVRLKPIEVRLPDALRPVYLVGQTDQRTRSRR